MKLNLSSLPLKFISIGIGIIATILILSLFAFGHTSDPSPEHDGSSSAEKTVSVCPNSNILGSDLGVVVGDNEAPEIILNGDAEIKLDYGTKYEEAGAIAVDNCDKVTVEISGEVDTKKAGEYIITYTAKDESENVSKAERKVIVSGQRAYTQAPTSGSKVIYLTFDDGPSDYTSGLLDVLKKYGVKATFFVTGAGSDDILRREYNEGHSIGLHTFSHSYSYLYSSVDNFFADLYKIQNRVENATGYKSYLMRFPGGSSNTVSRGYDGGTRIMSRLTRAVQDAGFAYFDWNISSGDAGGATTAGQVSSNVIRGLGSGSYVVLQHDTKGFSVAAVESIIQYGLANGYTFAPLALNSPTAHHGVSN